MLWNIGTRGYLLNCTYKSGSCRCIYTHLQSFPLFTCLLLQHQSRSTCKKGGEDSTNPNMPQSWKPSEGVAARVSGLANQSRKNICCPIRASGTSGTNEQQSSSSWTLTLPTSLASLVLFLFYVFISSFISIFSYFHLLSSQLILFLHLSVSLQGGVCINLLAHLHFSG